MAGDAERLASGVDVEIRCQRYGLAVVAVYGMAVEAEVARGHQRIGAREATARESELLELRKAAAVLTMERTAFDTSGRAVEYGQHCYRPDLYSFEITLVDR